VAAQTEPKKSSAARGPAAVQSDDTAAQTEPKKSSAARGAWPEAAADSAGALPLARRETTTLPSRQGGRALHRAAPPRQGQRSRRVGQPRPLGLLGAPRSPLPHRRALFPSQGRGKSTDNVSPSKMEFPVISKTASSVFGLPPV